MHPGVLAARRSTARVAVGRFPLRVGLVRLCDRLPRARRSRQRRGGRQADRGEARAAYVAVIRPLVRRLKVSAVVSDAEKASLGNTVARTPTPIKPRSTDFAGSR